MNWISIVEKSPYHSEIVLVRCSNKSYYVVCYLDTKVVDAHLRSIGVEPQKEKPLPGSFCSIEIPGNVLSTVTHWLPLKEIMMKGDSNAENKNTPSRTV